MDKTLLHAMRRQTAVAADFAIQVVTAVCSHMVEYSDRPQLIHPMSLHHHVDNMHKDTK